jgi:hypothetical protein
MQYWKLELDDPLYRRTFGDVDIRRFKVITDQKEQVGKVLDALTDGQETVYLHVETGSWLSPEWIVVPLGEHQIQPQQRSLCLLSSTAPVPAPVVSPVAAPTSAPITTANGHQTQENQDSRPRPAAVEQTSISPVRAKTGQLTTAPTTAETRLETGAETIRLLEERLLVEQHRRKIGEVVVHKVVDTQMIEVPVRRERLVVEQVSPEHKQLAIVDLGQTLEDGKVFEAGQTPDGQTLELGLGHQANRSQIAEPSSSAATLASTQQFLAKLAQRPQIAKAKLRLVFDDPELQTYYQRWLEQG